MGHENQVLQGACLEVLRELPGNIYDAVVTDPPYGLGTKEPSVGQIVAYLKGADLDTGGDFMGAKWDIPSVPVWREIFRVLKPGGHVACFGGTRTWDLIALGARAAGFEFRDSLASQFPALMWVHGQGFPKSLNISKAIDAAAGTEREVVGVSPTCTGKSHLETTPVYSAGHALEVTAPATEEAKKWEGWGTALKPSWEPILVFRKPLSGTVAENIREFGTGALNIDETRVKHSDASDFEKHKAMVDRLKEQGGSLGDSWKNSSDLSGASDVKEGGRWPPNVTMTHAPGCKQVGTQTIQGKQLAAGTIGGYQGSQEGHYEEGDGRQYAEPEVVEAWECIDGCPVKAMDEQSGDRGGGFGNQAPRCDGATWSNTATNGSGSGFKNDGRDFGYGDSGTASRFFPQFEGQAPPEAPFHYCPKATKREATLDGQIENNHPTKKPVKLMRWVCRLLTPKDGLVLDPYCGSGSTLQAAVEEGMRFTGIELNEDYAEIASSRMIIVCRLASEDRAQRDAFDLMAEFSDDE